MQAGTARAMRHGQGRPGATIACIDAMPCISARFSRSAPWILVASGGSAGRGKVCMFTAVASAFEQQVFQARRLSAAPCAHRFDKYRLSITSGRREVLGQTVRQGYSTN